MALTIGALLISLWSVKRRRRPHLSLDRDATLRDLMPSISGATQTTLLHGNDVELIENGAFWDRVLREMEEAKASITYETFLTRRGELTRRMTDILTRKAGEGVKVKMLLDGTGGRHFGHRDLKRLRESGVSIRKFHAIQLQNLGLLNARDHRKLVVIDGRIGYVGGHCLTDNWLGDAEDKQHFRDVSARVVGPVVAQLQSSFAENWIEETGEILSGDSFFPALEPAGDITSYAVWLSPSGNPSSVKILYYMAIHAAQRSITIQNPYFVPDPDARAALIDAVKRGVDVRVMVPSARASDQPLVQHASHHHFETLMRGGIKVFEYQRTLIHQKVITVDGHWSAIGSANFDDRSLELNDEVMLVVDDARIAHELEQIFERDLEHAPAVDLDAFSRRGVRHRLLDFGIYLFNEQL